MNWTKHVISSKTTADPAQWELSQYYHHMPLLPGNKNYTIDMSKQWNFPDSPLPQWMKDYLNWHDYKRHHWNSRTFKKERWLVMQCLKGSDRKCGGTSDRLKPILFILRVAYQSKRILFIHWTKPHPLTEFLVPPQGGVDWRTPPWMMKYLDNPAIGIKSEKNSNSVLETAMDTMGLARVVMQDYHYGRFWYDDQLLQGEAKLESIFHHVWKVFFTPSPAVRQRLETAMSELSLVPYNYTAAHCRVLYGMSDRPESVQKNWAENAINCASQLRPKMTIFFTSDSATATQYAQRYGMSRYANVKTRIPDPNPPLHIEFNGNNRPVSDFLDAFVDLYILAEATCVTYNKGGYGSFGLLIGRNATCGLRQDAIDRPKIHNPCHWVDEDPWNSTNPHTRHHYVSKTSSKLYAPIYLEPMP
jgi:hypothetical protein